MTKVSKGLLPRLGMQINGIHQRSVDVKDSCFHKKVF